MARACMQPPSPTGQPAPAPPAAFMPAAAAAATVELIGLRFRRRAVRPETFENVFAPGVSNERLDVNQIIAGLSAGIIHPDCLPPDAQKALGAEIKRREKKQMTASMFLTLVLGTMGVTRHRERLQKCVFLADAQFSQSRKGKNTTGRVYAWKAGPCGPFSETLEACVRDLEGENIVATFAIREGGRDHGIGYRLTAKGDAEFRRLLDSLEGESRAIHSLLGPKHGHTGRSPVNPVRKARHARAPGGPRARKRSSGAGGSPQGRGGAPDPIPSRGAPGAIQAR